MQLVRLQQRRQPAAVLCNAVPHCHTTWKQPSSPGHLSSLSGHFRMPLPVSRLWLGFCVPAFLCLQRVLPTYACGLLTTNLPVNAPRLSRYTLSSPRHTSGPAFTPGRNIRAASVKLIYESIPPSLRCHFQARAPFLSDTATKDHSQV